MSVANFAEFVTVGLSCQPRSMMKSRVLIVLAAVFCLSIGLFLGWSLREQAAIDACIGSGGKWLPEGGYCVDSVYGEIEV